MGLVGPSHRHVPSRDLESGQTHGRILRDRPPLHHQTGQGLPSPGLPAARHSGQKGVRGCPGVLQGSGPPPTRAVVLPREHTHPSYLHTHAPQTHVCLQLAGVHSPLPRGWLTQVPQMKKLHSKPACTLKQMGKANPRPMYCLHSSGIVLKCGPPLKSGDFCSKPSSSNHWGAALGK